MGKQFTSRLANGQVFQCLLQPERCRHQRNNRRCRRTCLYGLPLCWQHVRAVYRVLAKDSDVVPGERGLFAHDATAPPHAIVFRPGDRIIPYDGHAMSKHALDQRYPGHTPGVYALCEGNACVDAGCRRGWASFANGTNTEMRANRGVQANAEYTYDSNLRQFFIVATKAIRNNGKIIVNYGDDYVWGWEHSTKQKR